MPVERQFTPEQVRPDIATPRIQEHFTALSLVPPETPIERGDLFTAVTDTLQVPVNTLQLLEPLWDKAVQERGRLADETFRNEFVADFLTEWTDAVLSAPDITVSDKAVRLFHHLSVPEDTGERILEVLRKPGTIHKRKTQILEDVSLVAAAVAESQELSLPVAHAFTEICLQVRPLLGRKKKVQLEHAVATVIDSLRENAPYQSAAVYMALHDGMYAQDQQGDVQVGKKINVRRISRQTQFLPYLLQTLPQREFDRVGQVVRTALTDSKGVTAAELQVLDSSLADIPPRVFREMMDSFTQTGYVKKNGNEKYSLTSTGKLRDHLGFEEINRVQVAREMQDSGAVTGKTIKSIQDIVSIYRHNREEIKVSERQVTVSGSGYRMLYLSELPIGNKDVDIELAARIVDYYHRLPADQRPDVIVISGLLQGGFQHRDKNRRGALAIKSVDEQLQAAHVFMTHLQTIGVPILYNMSNDDFEICHNYALEAVRMVGAAAAPQSDTDKSFISYWNIDRLKQTREWDIHLSFQLNVAFPYMLRLGRRLRSADEVAEFTDGKLRREEYLLLYEAYRAGVRGEHVTAEQFGGVVDLGALPFEGRIFPFDIVDDVDLTVKTDNQTYVHYIKHNFNFGDKPMYQNPTAAMEASVGQLSARGETVPNVFTIQHQLQGLALSTGESWVISTPGFLRPDIRQRAAVANIQGEPIHRTLKTRRLEPTPGAFTAEQTDDGRTIFHVLTDKFLDKATIESDRSTVVYFNDWQTGSMTAQSDLQAKLIDIVAHELLPTRPVYLNLIGDMIQGRNYPGMELENKALGLVEIDDQARFVTEMLSLGLADVSAANVANLKRVGILPGNHEWNSQYVKTGAVHTGYLYDFFRYYYQLHGITPNAKNLQFYRQLQADRDHVKAWTGMETVAGYGMLSQHIIIEKGAKGNSAGAPVYQAQNLFTGVGSLVESVDTMVAGHWHHGQLALFNGKVATIAPALAGLSGYEWLRGYRPQLGALFIHLGGGRVPAFEYLSAQALYRHRMQGKYFSEEHLRSLGFKDDRHYDPAKHGFMSRKSGLQKALWDLKDHIIGDSHAIIA